MITKVQKWGNSQGLRRSMLLMMSCSRSRGTSEGIYRLRLCARTHVRTEAVAPRDVNVLPDDLLEVRRYSCVREKVVGHAWREIDEQVHIAVGSVLGTHDRAEYRDVNYAALTKFDFVGAKLREDVREARHASKPAPALRRLQRAERGDGASGRKPACVEAGARRAASYVLPASKTPSDCVARRLVQTSCKPSSYIIGARGFEPRTSCSRSRRANRAALRPETLAALELTLFVRTRETGCCA